MHFINFGRKSPIQFFHSPDGGAGEAGAGSGGGGAGSGGSGQSTQNGNGAGNGAGAGSGAGNSTANQIGGAGASSANQNGSDNPDGSQDGDKAGKGGDETFSMTKDGLTKHTSDAIARAKGQWERQQREAQATQQQEEARKAGDLQKLEDGYKTQISTKDARIAELEGELATERGNAAKSTRDAMVQRIGAKYKLPGELVEVLQGEKEADIEAHAQRLAKVAGKPVAPNTEGGNSTNTSGQSVDANKGGERKWTFNSEKGQAW